MRALTTADMARLFRELAGTITAARDELCRLDGVIGDADHGIAMEQGFTAASNAIDALSAEATLADQLNAAAKGFLNAVGASSGPLYATAFMRAAKAAGLACWVVPSALTRGERFDGADAVLPDLAAVVERLAALG